MINLADYIRRGQRANTFRSMIRERLLCVAKEYPTDLISHALREIPRIEFHIWLAIVDKDPNSLHICDLGGGTGLFSVTCAALGAEVLLVDDFNDPVNHQIGNSVLKVHETHGVKILQRDVIREGIEDVTQKFDVITTFDSMEHWHHSPKRLFRTVKELLMPNGKFILSAPNCVNLRKRITAPLGRGQWSSMQDWYEFEVFRGHVREPDVRDLRYIADDMQLENVRIYGYNWLGHLSDSLLIRTATRVIDVPLRYFPTLCSDIYMVGEKPL